jgi:hypothetical protein
VIAVIGRAAGPRVTARPAAPEIQNVDGSSPTGGSLRVPPLSRQLVYQALVEK